MKKKIFILYLIFMKISFAQNFEINDNIIQENLGNFNKNIEKENHNLIKNFTPEAELDPLAPSSNELYKKGKLLFNDERYYEAKIIFEELIDPNRKNDIYTPYALFYYALTCYYIGEIDHSESLFNYLKQNYENWEQIDEVLYWLIKIKFENKDYLYAIETINNIKEIKEKRVLYKNENIYFKRRISDYRKNYLEELLELKKHFLINIESPNYLKKILLENPKDEMVKEILCKRIIKDPFIDFNNPWTIEVIKKFKLDIHKYDPFNSLKSLKKKFYNVAIMLPFFYENISSNNNEFINLYKGINLAFENLKNEGIEINLFAYDTKNNLKVVKNLLDQKEFESMDLIIGPLFPKTVKLVANYAKEKQINMINPLSYNNELIKDNPFVFLFKSSLETQAIKAAEYFANKNDDIKKIGVIYSSDEKDLKKAKIFKKYIEKYTGKKVELMLELTQLQSKAFLGKFRDSKDKHKKTEKQLEEEEKNKAIFDDITHLYVATNDKLIVGTIFAIIEMRNIKPLIIGHQKWLEYKTVDFDKIQKMGVVLISPEYIDYEGSKIKNFRINYYKKYGELPDLYSCIGYEVMDYFCTALYKYGIYFQKEWNIEKASEGKLFEKIRFNKFHDNQELKIFTLKKGRCILEEGIDRFYPYM